MSVAIVDVIVLCMILKIGVFWVNIAFYGCWYLHVAGKGVFLFGPDLQRLGDFAVFAICFS